jgi:parallel beta-helix repeat protein
VVKGLVISRFSSGGVTMISSDQNRIEGNFVGTDPSGTTDLGNGVNGVEVASGTNNTVGGSSLAARNLISGNDGNGVQIGHFLNTLSNNRVQGNLIGTKKDGSTALGNSLNGVRISDSSNNTVSSNTLAFNGKDGVLIVVGASGAANGNPLLGNSIFSNVQEGIDLGDNGATPNDSGDGDSGPNTLQNFPVLSSAKTVSGTTTIQGKLNSAPNKSFIVQFFSNTSGNEGKKFVGQTGVTTDASGNASFAFSPATAVSVGQVVTATATLSETNNLNTS